MFLNLILLFTILPALELAILIRVGANIGASNTILIIILTGVAGAYLARIQGFTVLRNIQKNLEKGNMPTEEMLDGLMIFCGGVVLLTPGFLTDAMGFLLLIPMTRSLIKYWARKKIKQSFQNGSIVSSHPSSSSKSSSKLDNQDFEDADFH